MVEVHGSALTALFGAANGEFTDGYLVADVENFSGSGMDWRSNIPVTAVFLRVGTAGSLYTYEPTATFDVGLSAAGDIESVSFCYSPDPDMPPPQVEATPSPEQTPPDTAVAPSASSSAGSSMGGAVGTAVLIGVLSSIVIFRRRWAAILGRQPAKQARAAVVQRPARQAGPWSTSSVSYHNDLRGNSRR
jgi:hypothetical protein